MIVTVELWVDGGQNRTTDVRKRDIQKNIDALYRAINKKPLANDDISLMNTISILDGIKKQLPE